MDRTLSLLGLCRRAGKMSLGYESVLESIRKEKAQLIIIAENISERTKRNILFNANCKLESDKNSGNAGTQTPHFHESPVRGIGGASRAKNVKVLTLKNSKEDLSRALGKYAAVISINDFGFSKKLEELINND